MKLRNRRTGEIVEVESCNSTTGTIGLFFTEGRECDRAYDSLAELCEEWEDYEEPEFPAEYWIVNDLTGEPINIECSKYFGMHNYINDIRKRKEIGNYLETKEEAEKVVRKLKAWKRLKDKGFKFCGYEALGCGEIHFTSDWNIDDEYEKGQRRKDLDLLFGGE